MPAKTYEGIGASIEAALAKAQAQIPPRSGRDYATARVVEWGLQVGGFLPTKVFYVIAEEDPNAPFRRG